MIEIPKIDCNCYKTVKVMSSSGQTFYKCVSCGYYWDEDGGFYETMPEINDEPDL